MKSIEPPQTYANFLTTLSRSGSLLTEDPIRKEIFSVERLEQYAAYLAGEFQISSDPAHGRSLLPEVKENGQLLHAAYLSLRDATHGHQTVSPAAEWFLDNFHIIEEQLLGIKRDLPKSYYHELPKLAVGELAGYPRIYGMALAIIAHTDSRLDVETLQRFLQAFQQILPLQIGELWALPITLRIALIENLKPLALRIVSARLKREQADTLADRLLELAGAAQPDPEQSIQMLAREVGKPEEIDRAFVVQLTQRLRDQDPDVWPVFDWLERQLNTQNTNTLQATQLEHHSQAAAQVTVGNIITSMRLLSATDWREFFEKVSAVDPILAKDPAGAYSKMDFSTRDRYRHSVERIAQRAPASELEVARKAIELCATALTAHPDNERRFHVGYYLIDKGVIELEKASGYRPTLRERLSRAVLRYPTMLYLGFLTLLTTAAMLPVLNYYLGASGYLTGALCFGVLALIPASEIALTLLNFFITLVIKPKPLPKMNTEEGIPNDAKTMVVIPTLFTKRSVVYELIERLQVHYLANQDANIHFAILGDFGDADTETLASDVDLLKIARKGIESLNTRYHQPGEENRFFLFQRRRLWNPFENKWIGWERKRGKLLEFNRLLRGATDTTYLDSASPLSIGRSLLAQIKYVITLDSDTQLPRNSARRLVGAVIHPLNQPRYCPKKMRVTEGYGILQPRVSVDLVSASRSRFARIFSGNTGLDPYTTAVSDVYQDLFSEGSFTGKGLYVVDAFEAALKNRGPENSVLSHDLFEGSYARAALVTDIELYDDYPSEYDTYESRQHRWSRGDWQIAQWLLPWVPDAQGRHVRNNLSIISRWKIFDNLRRSLVAPATFTWLILGWTVLPGSSLVWTLLVVNVLFFSIYAPWLTGSFLNAQGLPWREHFGLGWRELRSKIEQSGLQIAFLASQSWNQVDAIWRTLYRKLISKKRLLEWVTFAQSQRARKTSPSLLKSAFPAPFLAVAITFVIAVMRPSALGIASPFLMLWFANPMIKRWSGVKPPNVVRPLGPDEILSFRQYARRTWHFFETFVGPEDHWLAPDNFQEDPKPAIAHRTSPTNIGLQLLATASAYDFGYIGVLEFVERLEKTFETLGKLAGMHGHFFNWYDTRTLEPLRPQYISTVDSGNLAGHLIALKQSCLELSERSFVNPNARVGLASTLKLLLDESLILDDVPQTSGGVTHKQLLDTLETISQLVPKESWENLAERLREAKDILNTLAADNTETNFAAPEAWLTAAIHQVQEYQRDLTEIVSSDVTSRLTTLVTRCDEIVNSMDFRFLFDEQRKLFVIGYNVSDSRRDNSYYDLFASESRLASFVAIAKGDIPEEHWFRLGRQMTLVKGGGRALVAWTATMFEYLMPLLVMRRYKKTLLDQTYETIVARQISYGKQHGSPWGVSESGYNARDLGLVYQYGPFGIPGLGLKRGLSDDLVISPYSTMLAAVIDPWAALKNLRKLEEIGALSRFGFYEAIDYTPQRLPENESRSIIRSFMAHHQGMSLVSLNNLINRSIMQKRFHAEPRVKATQLLLQERVPRAVAISKPRAEEVHSEGAFRFSSTANPRFYSDLNVSTPRTQILSNGTYSVMLTSGGGGYSRCGRLAVSRWREDWTRDHWGHFFYIRDLKSGKLWSTTYQPTTAEPDKYEVTFAENKVEFLRIDGEITTHTEIMVSPEDNVELRRISLTNQSSETCEFEVTSFMETVLAGPADDAAHPAFSNLFVQTEFVASERALLATRRRRSKSEKQEWGFHVVVTEGETLGPLQYETDRARFIGRGRSPFAPIVLKEARPLSNTVGSVLDPIFSLRESVRIPPGATVRLAFATGVAPSRQEALTLSDKYHDVHTFVRESDIAWTQSQVQLRHLNIGSDKAHLFQRLAGRIIYSDPSLRPRSHTLALNTKSQASLWAYGISGDLPIILGRISDEKDMPMVRELLHAHEYLRLKGLAIDLVILNEHPPSYMQFLQEALQRQIRMSGSQALLDKPGGVFIRRTDIMNATDVLLLKSVARVVLSAEKGTLEEQLKRRPLENELPGAFIPTTRKQSYTLPPAHLPQLPRLKFFNGLGGFEDTGESYQILLTGEQNTPAPWVNVIANDRDFGFVVSESGSGYTWSVNSRENRLTSWANDAVSDPVSETIYIRDEETGETWTPTPLPIREPEPYLIKHGQGYTQFEHTSHGIAQKLQMFVPVDATVKISRLRLRNLGSQTRTLSVTSFVEWVLGFQRGTATPSVITEADPETGAIFAKNPYNNEFAERVAFTSISEKVHTFTCDRREFLGRNGSPSRPAALERTSLSGRAGAGLDPCTAIQTSFSLAPGEERVIDIFLGQADTAEAARNLTIHYQTKMAVTVAFEKVKAYWDEALGNIRIKTPDTAMNMLVNRWLLYQTLSCRVWARTAFYQSGGAFGFRDQLQDVMALIYSKPEVARAQILCAAARQFKEGDVQHWWHPPTGRGVRTRFSDDLLWLPFVVGFYVKVVGDRSILSETVPFIQAAELEPGQDDAYLQPKVTEELGTILEHCMRALDRSLKVGAHGLPLMGSGDWNDGMNRVGNEGKGESVWVGWFLCNTLSEFIPICETSADTARAQIYREHLEKLKKAIEENAWDGDWYRRAYFDNGTALGSAFNEECRIDSIAQSWAVLSGVGDPQRAAKAMLAVDENLIDRDDGLIKLFTPPFDKSSMDPGYIKAYVPGVRENGGQYTHAAIWTVMAYAAMGDGDRAGELFSLLNPINHASTRTGVHKYKVEPYVVAADIYAHHPHVGRGGWTWYTGSASWMYRAALESILGFELRGNELRIKPSIPHQWEGFEITYLRGATEYHIQVANIMAHGAPPSARVQLDDVLLGTETIPLVDDGKKHSVFIQLFRSPKQPESPPQAGADSADVF